MKRKVGVEEKVIDKVKKILAKAANNPFPKEAEAALLKAQELMVKHNLTMADVAMVDNILREVVTEPAHDPNRVPWWYVSLSRVLADNFRCYTYTTTWARRGGSITFMGLKEDVELAKTLFQYAILYIQYQTQLVRRRLRKQGIDTAGAANDYIQGFITGLKTRFDEQVAANCWAVALLKDEAVEEKFKNMTFKKGKTKTVHRQFNKEAYEKGFNHGKNFDKPAGQIK